MPHSYGYRARTRDMFCKDFRKAGLHQLSKYFVNYKIGDIVDINQGDRVPADCILIEEMNITVDQSMYYKK